MTVKKLKLIDLFAGAGGLSLGFRQTGKYRIVAAVEKNPNAQITYRNNFPGVDLYDDITCIDFTDFNERYGTIDIVIGGPPCQGFSNANRQHNQAINLNNKLVKEYIRAILQIQPKAFLMENVEMLKSEVHRFYIEKSDVDIVKKYNIPIKDDSIFLLDERLKFDGVLKLLQSRQNVKDNLWPKKLFKDVNIIYKQRNSVLKLKRALDTHLKQIKKEISTVPQFPDKHINDLSKRVFDFFERYDSTAAVDGIAELLDEPIALQKMLIHAEEIYSNGIEAEFDAVKNVTAKAKSCAVHDYLNCILRADDNGYSINSGVLSAVEFGMPQKRRRFVVMGIKKEYAETVEMPAPDSKVEMTNVYDALADLKNAPVYYSAEEDDRSGGSVIRTTDLKKVRRLSVLRDFNGRVYNHIIPRTRETALQRFRSIKPGENFHALSKEMKENTYTNADRTQNTVYFRLNYEEPSGTVINVRKSMWIHPVLDRAVSVREAARLQTFPDSFRFYGHKDSEYQQVGNAVPPFMAKAIAESMASQLNGRND